MLPAIAFRPFPYPLRGMEMILLCWLETSSLNQHETVGPVSPFNHGLLWKYLLDGMIALVIGTSDPDALGLIDGRQCHLCLSLSPQNAVLVTSSSFLASSWSTFEKDVMEEILACPVSPGSTSAKRCLHLASTRREKSPFLKLGKPVHRGHGEDSAILRGKHRFPF